MEPCATRNVQFIRLIALIALLIATGLVFWTPLICHTYYWDACDATLSKNSTCNDKSFDEYWWQNAINNRDVERVLQRSRLAANTNSSEMDSFITNQLYPLNGQQFVILGSALIILPMLLTTLVLRLRTKDRYWMEETMVALLGIGLSITFAVIEGYAAAGVEIEAAWKSMCTPELLALACNCATSEQLEKADARCNDVDIVIYSWMIASMCYVLLTALFALDFAILLVSAEDTDWDEYIETAALLHRNMSAEAVTKSIRDHISTARTSY